MRKLFVLVLFLTAALAPAALAEVKVYSATPPGGTPGDQIQNSTNLSPNVMFTPGLFQGSTVLTDMGTGIVTMTELIVTAPNNVMFDTTTVFGPGSFVFVVGDTTNTPAQGQTGFGSTAKGTGAIVWGVIGGWNVTGMTFCASSPTSTCDNNGLAHGVTATPNQPSSTYDLGTWTFDAEGDYEGSVYIQRSSNGGMANISWQLRSRFVGSGAPMLPLAGMLVLALALVVIGARSLLRKK